MCKLTEVDWLPTWSDDTDPHVVLHAKLSLVEKQVSNPAAGEGNIQPGSGGGKYLTRQRGREVSNPAAGEGSI